MARHARRNEGKTWSPAAHRGGHAAAKHGPTSAGSDWVWGWHAALAALANPQRGAPLRLVSTPERSRELSSRFPALPPPEIVDAAEIARLLPAGAAHQGVALRAAPIEPLALAELAAPAIGVLVMLDHVTDPQNVGAVFRSAAAFGARGVVVQDRHAPAFTGALAKAAAGAMERMPVARVVNLSRALETLTDLGWTSIGLDSDAETRLSDALDAPPLHYDDVFYYYNYSEVVDSLVSDLESYHGDRHTEWVP